MPSFSIHLVHFIDIIVALIAVPAAGFYTWRGVRRRKDEQRRIGTRTP